MSPKRLLMAICLLFFANIAAQAQPSVHGTCVGEVLPNGQLGSCNSSGNTPTSGPSAVNSAVGNASYQAGYALGAAFTKWLFSPDTNSGAVQQQQRLQKQQMMEVIRLRQQEAERQHRAEEANRLAEMYNRLASTLKLGGLPQLQLKTSGGADGSLQLKLGDSSQANTIAGLPGSSTTFAQHLSDLSATDGLQLKLGDGAQASGTAGPPGGDPSTIDFNKMTPQQLADIAESVSKQPPQPTQQMTMRDFPQTLDGKTDLHRLDSSSATPGAGNQNPNAAQVTGNEGGAAQPGGQVQAQQPPQVMRNFQQTLDGKSDLIRLGSGSATPNAVNQKSNPTPAIGNSSGAPQPSGPASSIAVAPATGGNSQRLQATSPAAGASVPVGATPQPTPRTPLSEPAGRQLQSIAAEQPTGSLEQQSAEARTGFDTAIPTPAEGTARIVLPNKVAGGPPAPNSPAQGTTPLRNSALPNPQPRPPTFITTTDGGGPAIIGGGQPANLDPPAMAPSGNVGGSNLASEPGDPDYERKKAIDRSGMLPDHAEVICDEVQRSCSVAIFQHVNPADRALVRAGKTAAKPLELKAKSSTLPQIAGMVPVNQCLSKLMDAISPTLADRKHCRQTEQVRDYQAGVKACIKSGTCTVLTWNGIPVLADKQGRPFVSDYDPYAIACTATAACEKVAPGEFGIGTDSERQFGRAINARMIGNAMANLPENHLGENGPGFPLTAFLRDPAGGRCKLVTISNYDELQKLHDEYPFLMTSRQASAQCVKGQ